MASINSRTDFITYCLRRLGAPVIKINVSPEQIDDRIADAIDKFNEFHYDGSLSKFISIVLTQSMIDNNQLVMPSNLNITTVVSVFEGHGIANNTQSLANQAILSDIAKQGTDSISRWMEINQQLQTIETVFKQYKMVSFSPLWNKNEVYISTNLSRYKPGDGFVAEVYLANDPETNTVAWNSHWLKMYATALIKYQWGQNLSKFSNLSLPGGVQFNADRIMQEANEEIQRLEDEVMSIYSMPALGKLA